MNNMKEVEVEKKINESKFNFNKNFLFFLILPLIIIIVGVVLLCTVNFNLGTDFTGASIFKVYVNNEASFEGEGIESFDLNDKSDYNKVYDKIVSVLHDNNLDVVSVRTSSINITNYHVYGGQALEIEYKNTGDTKEEIYAMNDIVRNGIIAEFGYENYQDAVSDIDLQPATNGYWWSIGIVAAIMFAIIAVAIYMAFRFDVSIFITALLMTALDVFMTIGLVLICRVPVNMNFGIVIFATLLMTILNLFFFYSKAKDGLRSGKFERTSVSEMSNMITKDLSFKKSLFYAAILLFTILLIAISVPGVREVALGILLGAITTFYTSEFLLPGIWSICYHKKRIRHKPKNQ